MAGLSSGRPPLERGPPPPVYGKETSTESARLGYLVPSHTPVHIAALLSLLQFICGPCNSLEVGVGWCAGWRCGRLGGRATPHCPGTLTLLGWGGRRSLVL